MTLNLSDICKPEWHFIVTHEWIERLVYGRDMPCPHQSMRHLLCAGPPSPYHKMDHVSVRISILLPLTSPGLIDDQPFHRLPRGKTQQEGEKGNEGTFCVLAYHMIQLSTVCACSFGLQSFRCERGGGDRGTVTTDVQEGTSRARCPFPLRLPHLI